MAIMWEPATDRQMWDAFIAANANDSGLLQSWAWGDLHAAHGRGVTRYWIRNDGEPIAVVQFLRMPLGAGFAYLYAPRGPVLARSIAQAHRAGVDRALREIAATHPRIVFLRVEPAESSVGPKILEGWHWNRAFQPTGTLRLALRAHHRTPDLAENRPASAATGSSALDVSTDTSRTSLPVSLDAGLVSAQKRVREWAPATDEALRSAMHPKTRYNIGVAEREGVSVARVESTPKMTQLFWGLLRETAARDGFTLHPEDYYRQILAHTRSAVYVASWNGQPLAAALVAFFGTTAYYLHGGSASTHRDAQAPVALHWFIMRDVRQQGMTVYDLWGADEVRWPGVTRFKRGFAPDLPLTEYAGAFDWPRSRFFYTAYTTAQRVMQFVRGRRG